jgi:GWxTD domain-containing protein
MAGRHAPRLILSAALLAAPALIVAPGAEAQGAAVVAELNAFRDSVATVQDTASLRRAEHALSRATDASAGQAIRAAMLDLRLGTIWDLDRAEARCRDAVRLAPEWPYSWYCLALATETYGQATAAEPRNLGLTPGAGAIEQSVDWYLEALRREPSFAPAALALGELALGRGAAGRRAEALAALRRAVPVDGRTTRALLLTRGRIERLAGDPDSALAVFHAFDAAGGDHALALLELARTELGSVPPGPGGDSLYFTGAALDDTAAIAGYRHDLLFLVSDTALRGFDGAQGAARAKWLRDFWEARDLVDLQPAGTRLPEHYRRLRYAEQHFVRLNGRRFTYCDPSRGYDSGLPDLDDRGVVYLRYGAPTMRVTTPVWGMLPAESWRYDLPDADTLVLHFLDLHDVHDYRLVPTALDLATVPGCPLGTDAEPQAVMQTRAALLPEYDRWLAGTDLERARIERRDIQRGEASIPRVTTTDVDPLRFARDLRGIGRAWALGASPDGALAHFAFAVFVPDSLAARVAPRPAVRLVGMQRNGMVDGWSGTPVDGRGVPADPGWWWIGHVTLPVRSGRTYLRLALLAGDSTGTIIGWDSVDAAPAESGPRLGPLIVGARSTSVPWATAARDSAFFSPFRNVHRDDPLEVYAELAGLDPGTPYDAALTLAPADRSLAARLLGKAPPQVSVSWQGMAERAVMPIRRTVGVGALVPGSYVVRLAVRVGGRELRSEDRITIE